MHRMCSVEAKLVATSNWMDRFHTLIRSLDQAMCQQNYS